MIDPFVRINRAQTTLANIFMTQRSQNKLEDVILGIDSVINVDCFDLCSLAGVREFRCHRLFEAMNLSR